MPKAPTGAIGRYIDISNHLKLKPTNDYALGLFIDLLCELFDFLCL